MNGIKNASIIKKRNNLPHILAGTMVLLVFLATLNFFNVQIKNTFFIVSSPVQKTFWIAGETVSSYFSSVLKSGNLAAENLDLKKENQKLLSQIIFLQAINNANQAQSAVSLACQDNDFDLLMAGVIGSDSNDELTINKGSDDGIVADMPVVNQQGVLFGKIDNVYKNFSSVMLISNKNSVINVKVLYGGAGAKGNEIDGVVRGIGGFEVLLDLVPVDDTIEVGDILKTSSLEGSFPKDVLIGEVSQVKKNDQSPHQQADVKLFMEVPADNLFVITNYKR